MKSYLNTPATLYLGMSSGNGEIYIQFFIDGARLTDTVSYIFDDENMYESVNLRYYMTASNSGTHNVMIEATRLDAGASYLQYSVLKVQII